MEQQPHSVEDYFACNVFNEDMMRDRLPKNVYRSLKRTRNLGVALDKDVAEVVANAMKDWAISRGATHYTHWFQPMTGITAEKHDAFLTLSENGRIIQEFNGKELIKGEPDASSFPSGGLRSTYEARGYTAWDPTSPAFLKEGTLCIPTAFCSYSGEVLDKKTPLLRSMEACNKQALRILRLFGNSTAQSVKTTAGAEQEYFLIDKKYYDQRDDLILTGRTLFGARSPKGQELEDHYFGMLDKRVMMYMQELDEELWKLGVYAKTKHNEAAPAQHELAPIFSNSNIAADHNQLTMELMKKIAIKHGLYCLLQEKPFEGVNGSGKHNNWSMSTDDGQNLLDPGRTARDNWQFLTFLCAFIKGVDEYADLIRLSAASAGNDHRLGGHEAPPAIISIFLGEHLTNIFESIETVETDFEHKEGNNNDFKIGVEALPNLPRDTTDRNRTSPLAFTGNKFEFRMLGSADSISCCNVMLNTIMAQELSYFATRLENARDFTVELRALLSETYQKHKRIIFNGNNYAKEWVVEAKRRGLHNHPTAVDALSCYDTDWHVAMFERFGIYTRQEIQSRKDILLENYFKSIRIEALTMIDMTRRQIVPAVIKYMNDICNVLSMKTNLGFNIVADAERNLLTDISKLFEELSGAVKRLDKIVSHQEKTPQIDGYYEISKYYQSNVVPAMEHLRTIADQLECIVAKEYWPFPTYADMLFNL